jgi:hypothetical protein
MKIQNLEKNSKEIKKLISKKIKSGKISEYKEFVKEIKEKDKLEIVPLDNIIFLDDTNNNQYDEFIENSSWLQKIEAMMNMDNQFKENLIVFWNLSTMYKEIYKSALTKQNQFKKIELNDYEDMNHIIFGNGKILKIKKRNWIALENKLRRYDSNGIMLDDNYNSYSVDKYRDESDINTKYSFKNNLKKSILLLKKKPEELKTFYSKPKNIDEEQFLKKLEKKIKNNIEIEVNSDENIKEMIEKNNIKINGKDYMLEETILNIINDILKLDERITDIVTKIQTTFIIAIQKQRKNTKEDLNIQYIPITGLYQKIGEIILEGAFLNGQLKINWKKNEIYQNINNLLNLQSLDSSNKKLNKEDKDVIQLIFKKIFTDNIDINKFSNDTLKTLVQLIIFKMIEDYNNNSKVKEDLKIDKKRIERLIKNLTTKKGKIGYNICNLIRINSIFHLRETSLMKNKELYEDNKKKKSIANFRSRVIKIVNCNEICSYLNYLKRPFLIGEQLIKNENRGNKYEDAFFQRHLNIIHNNINGNTKVKKSLVNFRRNYVSHKAGDFLFSILINEFLAILPNIEKLNTNEVEDIISYLNMIPYILSLYYLKKGDISDIYIKTNDNGKLILKKLINLILIFSHKSRIEKEIEENLNSNQFIKNYDTIRKLFNKIKGIKYTFIEGITECFLFSGIQHYTMKYNKDGVNREYLDNKGLNIQSHYVVRSMIRPYTQIYEGNNTYIKNNKEIIDKIIILSAKNMWKKAGLIDKESCKKLEIWGKNLKTNSLVCINNQEKIFKEHFCNDFNDKKDNENFINELVNNKHTFTEEVITAYIKYAAENIKNIRKLSIKLIELQTIINKEIEPIIELDAVASGLQMQAITFKSLQLGMWSKLIEGQDEDIYSRGKVDFMFFIEIISSFVINNKNLLKIKEINYEKLEQSNEDNLKEVLEEIENFNMEAINCDYKETVENEVIIMLYKEIVEKISINNEELNEDQIRYLLDLLKKNKSKNNIHIFRQVSMIKYGEDVKKNYYRFLKPLLTDITTMPINITLETKINEDENLKMFAFTYISKANILINKILNKKIEINIVQSFIIRLMILDLFNYGKKILIDGNVRDEWKNKIMTYSYNSTAYGRINTTIERLQGYNKEIVEAWANLFEDYFDKKFRLTYLADCEIMKKISQKVSKYAKATNEPIKINNEFIEYIIYPKKMEVMRAPVNIMKKQGRGYMLKYMVPKIDDKGNFIINSEKIFNMFGPNWCHASDALIVNFILEFEKEINRNLYKKNINYRITIEPNHDSFRGPNYMYLESIIELAYHYLLEANLMKTFVNSFADQNIKNDLEKIINSNKEDHIKFKKLSQSLKKGFVKA